MNDFDLNHVRALHCLLEEAHVTRAARRLGITPAAASNALKRLRIDFADPLLVRSGRTLARTPRAEELRAPAREVMAAAARLFEQGRPFDPATEAWEVILTTSDRIAELLLPVLDRLLRARAPRAKLTVRTSMVDVGGFLRERGGVAIVPTVFKDRDLRAEPIFREGFVCVLRRGHPLVRARLTPRRFAELEHVLVAPLATSNRGPIDVLLEKEGLSRRIGRVVMSFALVAPLVAQSDCVAVLPRSVAELHGKDLVQRPVPLRMEPAEMSLAWYLGNERDPRHVFTRALLHDAVRAAGLGRSTGAQPARRTKAPGVSPTSSRKSEMR